MGRSHWLFSRGGLVLNRIFEQGIPTNRILVRRMFGDFWSFDSGAIFSFLGLRSHVESLLHAFFERIVLNVIRVYAVELILYVFFALIVVFFLVLRLFLVFRRLGLPFLSGTLRLQVLLQNLHKVHLIDFAFEDV